MTIVRVATKNPTKVMAIRKAFERYFKEVDVIPFEVQSGVSEQPINEDVFEGAENRLRGIEKVQGKYDYLVSCEGGLIKQCGYWFNIQVTMVKDKNGKVGIGLSQGYQIPTKYVEKVINTSLANVLDMIFDGKGGIRVLSKGQFTRERLIEDSLVMALTRVLNGENW